MSTTGVIPFIIVKHSAVVNERNTGEIPKDMVETGHNLVL